MRQELNGPTHLNTELDLGVFVTTGKHSCIIMLLFLLLFICKNKQPNRSYPYNL